MKLIIGLGNPGKNYNETRHNVGFWFLDRIKEKYHFPDFSLNGKFEAEISKGSIGKNECLLVKPQTFMNLSGKSVRAILDFYKLNLSEILVIHDDLDIPMGKFKLATNSSSAGHNGVQNIIENVGTQEFKRLRIGIGQEKEGALVCRVNAHDFVLEKFSDLERENLEKIYPELEKTLEDILK